MTYPTQMLEAIKRELETINNHYWKTVKWEYLTVTMEDYHVTDVHNMTNDQGRAGWELVSVSQDTTVFIFKRPVR